MNVLICIQRKLEHMKLHIRMDKIWIPEKQQRKIINIGFNADERTYKFGLN